MQHSDWAAPIVPMPKSDGSVRICGDFKLTANAATNLEVYPLPRIEDIFASLSGGKQFSKLDLAQAYLQLPLAEELQPLVTIDTHKGLYWYQRLPFGVASAPAIFQCTMETLLQRLENAAMRLKKESVPISWMKSNTWATKSRRRVYSPRKASSKL